MSGGTIPSVDSAYADTQFSAVGYPDSNAIIFTSNSDQDGEDTCSLYFKVDAPADLVAAYYLYCFGGTNDSVSFGLILSLPAQLGGSYNHM